MRPSSWATTATSQATCTAAWSPTGRTCGTRSTSPAARASAKTRSSRTRAARAKNRALWGEAANRRSRPISFPLRACRVLLFVRPVGRADERPGEHGAEAERLALLLEPAELVGVHPAVDPRVLRRGLQVLADRDDVDSVLAEIAHGLDDLVVRFAEADDEPRLRQHRVLGDLLRAAKQPERLLVGRLRSAHPRVKPADG